MKRIPRLDQPPVNTYLQRSLGGGGGKRGQSGRGGQKGGGVGAREPEHLVQVPLDEAESVCVIGGPRVKPHRPRPTSKQASKQHSVHTWHTRKHHCQQQQQQQQHLSINPTPTNTCCACSALGSPSPTATTTPPTTTAADSPRPTPYDYILLVTLF